MSGESFPAYQTFFLKLPPMQQLCHVVLKLQPMSSSRQRSPQNQMLVCRQFLFLCRDVIASPQFNDEFCLDVVMSVAYFKEKKFLPLCKKLALQPVHASSVKAETLQACFAYTLKFRISSEWNQISNFLVKAIDVVTNPGKLQAIELGLVVSDSQMTATVRPYLIRNPPPSLDNFDICYQALRQFQEDSDFTIEDFSIYRSWCYVLPSMKRGQLVRVSHKMPIVNSEGLPAPFNDYSGLRRYWKNLHGIRLPESENETIFGSIYFKLIGHQLFTYPLCCLRTKEIQIMPRCDGPAIIKDFMICLQRHMDMLCGVKLAYSSKPCYCTNKLSEASQIVPGRLQNVTTNIPEGRIGYPSSLPRLIAPSVTSASKKVTVSPNHPDIIPSSQVGDNTIKTINMEDLDAEKLDRNTQDRPNLILPTNSNGKYIPVFAQRKRNISSSAQCGKKIKPSLSAKIINSKLEPRMLSGGGKLVSKAASEKFKTPRQDLRPVEFDSGYDSTGTPGQVPKKSSKPSERKYLPKKLCFDHTSMTGMQVAQSRAEWTESYDSLHSTNNIGHSRSLVGTARKFHPDVVLSTFTPVVNEGTDVAFNRRCHSTANSAIKIMKNHSFDKIFQPASAGHPVEVEAVGNKNAYLETSNRGRSQIVRSVAQDRRGSAKSPLKIIKNHSFNKLFQSASSVQGICSREQCPGSKSPTQLQELASPSPIRVMKRHSFEKLFQSASSVSSGVVCAEARGSDAFDASGFARTIIPSFRRQKPAFGKSAAEKRPSDINETNNALGIGIGPSSMAAYPKVLPSIKESVRVLNDGCVTAKRSKAAADFNVDEMARSSKLSKVNAPALLAWLKSKGVAVKCREKKESLLMKVRAELKMQAPAGKEF